MAGPGPVHLNFPLRDPLAPVAEPLDPADWEGRPGGRPWTEVSRPAGAPDPGDLARRLEGVRRGVIVCGEPTEPVAEPVARLAAARGWPVLADPASGVRCGPHDRSHVVAHYDVLLRAEAFAREHRPELVVRVGAPPVSQSLRAWMAGAEQVVVDPHASWHDPSREAALVVAAAPGPLLDALAAEAGDADRAWAESWRHADALVPPALASMPEAFEGRIPAALEPALPDDALVWLSYSMPIRDVEAFFPASPKPLRFLAGRGANGIDGVVSSAAGAAIGSGPAGVRADR